MKAGPIAALALFAGLILQPASAEDWPQFRGPNHNGTTSETIPMPWPHDGPRQVWKVPLTDGFSTITVASGKAYTLVSREIDGANQEVCVALDADTGKEIWSAKLGVAKYDNGGDRGVPGNDGGDGPRSTPSVDGGRVYTYSSRLVLECFDAATGNEIWKKNVISEYGGHNISWESAASPLIEGDLVFVAGGGAGQSLLAFDKADGHLVWKALSERMTHSTPVAATILDVHQIIFFTQSGLVSVEPKTGALLWRFPFKFSVSTAMSPVVSGNTVYCSAGYGVGASACRITRTGDTFTATPVWFQPASVINNHWSTPVCANGFLYGLFGQAQFGSGPLKCVDLASGKVMWSKAGFGPGGCTLAGDHVLVLSDSGDLVLVKASAAGYSEEARSHILSGKCWNSVSVSNGRIYARSTKEGVCLDLSAR
ncbi:MAG TPA: PQQ-binding-like beta-propeller repeat protein [Verrucomicrobiae bacterium]|jgi:outer membrane protein assembly factor BamB|nr:PQQ-binding-like beta-propeller repeat protein [Verrucomicrobiae bacterium]